ncbi:MAG: (d)CMP kinase [Desulfomonilaceae bacterium]
MESQSHPSAARSRIITIDGPAGVGKTTAARTLSKKIGFLLLDSGALYRAVALHLLREGVSPDSLSVPREKLISLDLKIEENVGDMLIYLQGEEISPCIRTEEIAVAASKFSTLPEVREFLLPLQRETARRQNTVAEGRDMGTVVFPDADLKFFFMADLVERAQRRYRELLRSGANVLPEEVEADIRSRDERDATRLAAPLVRPKDAIPIDTTRLTPEAVVEQLLSHLKERGVLPSNRLYRFS